jgi:hypothetical protein
MIDTWCRRWPWHDGRARRDDGRFGQQGSNGQLALVGATVILPHLLLRTSHNLLPFKD